MYSQKEKIGKLSEKEIDKQVNLGEQAGGSGHLAYVSYRIDDIRISEAQKGYVQIDYDYTLFTEAEFTCYPDNPPYESSHQNRVLV